MKNPQIIIDALTDKIDDLEFQFSEFEADANNTIESNIKVIENLEDENEVCGSALSIVHSFFLDKHPDLLADLADYVLKTVTEDYNQKNRYRYGLKAIDGLVEVLGIDGESEITGRIDVVEAQLINLNDGESTLRNK